MSRFPREQRGGDARHRYAASHNSAARNAERGAHPSSRSRSGRFPAETVGTDNVSLDVPQRHVGIAVTLEAHRRARRSWGWSSRTPRDQIVTSAGTRKVVALP